jgi:uncharacterized membrane-anchored protein
MKLALRRRRAAPLPGVSGIVRVDRITRDLAARLHPGEIALVDHLDLDRASAEALLARGVGAVVNVAESISGRYPNLGPGLLVAAGVPLVDGVGAGIFGRVRDGAPVRLHGGVLYAADSTVLATGTEQTAESVAARTAAARQGLAAQLGAFGADTAEFLRRDPDLLDGPDAPDLGELFEGRHALVVAAGPGEQGQVLARLGELRPYLRRHRPVLVGVDAGVGVLHRAGLRPDVALVGNADETGCDPAAAEALHAAGQVVATVDPAGDPWALWRLRELGLSVSVFRTAVAAPDAAALLAGEGGAELIVTVGLPRDLVGLLDGGRARLASSFLAGLRLGGAVVDSAAVIRLSRRGPARRRFAALLLAAGLGAAAGVGAVEPVSAHWIALHFHEFTRWL